MLGHIEGGARLIKQEGDVCAVEVDAKNCISRRPTDRTLSAERMSGVERPAALTEGFRTVDNIDVRVPGLDLSGDDVVENGVEDEPDSDGDHRSDCILTLSTSGDLADVEELLQLRRTLAVASRSTAPAR